MKKKLAEKLHYFCSGQCPKVSGQDTSTVGEPVLDSISCYACGLEDVDPVRLVWLLLAYYMSFNGLHIVFFFYLLNLRDIFFRKKMFLEVSVTLKGIQLRPAKRCTTLLVILLTRFVIYKLISGFRSNINKPYFTCKIIDKVCHLSTDYRFRI